MEQIHYDEDIEKYLEKFNCVFQILTYFPYLENVAVKEWPTYLDVEQGPLIGVILNSRADKHENVEQNLMKTALSKQY